MCKHNYNNPDPEYRRMQAEIFKQNTDIFFGIMSSKELDQEHAYKRYKPLKGEDDDDTTPLLSTGSSTSYQHYSHHYSSLKKVN